MKVALALEGLRALLVVEALLHHISSCRRSSSCSSSTIIRPNKIRPQCRILLWFKWHGCFYDLSDITDLYCASLFNMRELMRGAVNRAKLTKHADLPPRCLFACKYYHVVVRRATSAWYNRKI